MLASGIVAGIGLAAGLVLVVRGLLPASPALSQALTGQAAPSRSADSTGPEDFRDRVARRLEPSLRSLGADLDRAGCDLRVLERTPEQHLVEKLTASAVGLALPLVLAGLAAAGGAHIGPGLVAFASLGLAIGGFLLPEVVVRSQAAHRRRGFNFALSSYLDLTQIILASGAGVETALVDAAASGHGWAFRRIRSALARAQITGESPWQAFHRLGKELDLPELRETAASLTLAGTHGAKVRSSLAARAESLRARDLAAMEAEAEAATERMSVPSVVLVVGFIVFVGFPAAHEILGF